MFNNDEDEFVRSPGSCSLLGLECRSCISEAARQLADASPELTPVGAVKLFKLMYEQPSCLSMQNTFLHSYQQSVPFIPSLVLAC